MDAKELEALDLLHYTPADVNGEVLSPVVYDQLLCLTDIEGEVVLLSPHCQLSDFHPVGCLLNVGDQAYHRQLTWCWSHAWPRSLG